MKILVTGGAGFIGSHVVDIYVENGHEVVVLDNLSTGDRANLNPKATFYLKDIRDRDMGGIFAREKFEIVNHHAAQMDVRKSVDDPGYDADVNVLGTVNLLQLCAKSGVKKFIFASTGGAIYGEQRTFPADEEHLTRPLSPYGVTKLTGEKYLHFYQQTYGLDYVVLRYSNVYGPRQNPHGEAGVVAIFASNLLAGKPAVINGDGSQTRDYVYVGDVARSNLLALNHTGPQIFNIGTGLETDVNTIFKELNRVSGTGQKEIHVPPKPGEQRRSVINNRKAKAVLGWEPGVELSTGLEKTVDFFRKKMGIIR
ncbi:NAD-dependent epimerase/dehydratase family protein [candidate division KSB1 bacterium]|nr:NAD-dependent epimerase/dehydratase family protein [candidate division KSB1 bacterium]